MAKGHIRPQVSHQVLNPSNERTPGPEKDLSKLKVYEYVSERVGERGQEKPDQRKRIIE